MDEDKVGVRPRDPGHQLLQGEVGAGLLRGRHAHGGPRPELHPPHLLRLARAQLSRGAEAGHGARDVVPGEAGNLVSIHYNIIRSYFSRLIIILCGVR